MRQAWEDIEDDPIWEVLVHWCTSRPPRDEHCTVLLIAAQHKRTAHLIAAQWTLANPSCVQATRTTTLGVSM